MSTEDKAIIVAQNNPDNLPTDTKGNVADVDLHEPNPEEHKRLIKAACSTFGRSTEESNFPSDGSAPRYTEADALKEAGTDAHTDLENADLLKARVLEVVNTDTSFAGITKHVSLILWETVSNELHAVTGQLRTAKTNEERVALLEKISNHHHRLGIITDNFLE